MGYEWTSCLKQTLIDYCKNTTLIGYKYLVQSERPKLEKLIWFVILLIILIITCYMFRLLLFDYDNNTTITALENTRYHIRNIPFPGIAICNVNKISYKRAVLISKEISERTNHSFEMILGLIRLYGKLYDFELEDMDNLIQIQRIIEFHNNSMYDYNELLSMLSSLATPCEEIVVRCLWLTKEMNCSEIILTRMTTDGPCCTFNYVKLWANNTMYKKFPTSYYFQEDYYNVYFTNAGIESGLTIVVRSEPDDYFYPITSNEGLSVKVFDAFNYPDISTGGLIESFVPLEHEVFLQISAIKTQSTNALDIIPLEKRGCILENETHSTFDNFYSYTDCLAECKMKSILALCQCIPFYFTELLTETLKTQICTVSDIVCLNRYKDKWINVYPYEDLEELHFERENSIYCPTCMPCCWIVTYMVDSDYNSITNSNNTLIDKLNISEHSIIHIYSAKEYATLYETDVYYNWFDVLSNFGGICSLFIGFSLISIAEFLYFITIWYYRLLYRSNHLRN